MDVLPALVGVGYICGAKVASYLLSGAVLGWFVIMPLLVLVGGDNILFPASVPIRELSVDQLWGNYVRYIGAGAVAAGGIFSLLKSFPLIASTFRSIWSECFSKYSDQSGHIHSDHYFRIFLCNRICKNGRCRRLIE